jgi:hypothetical protein
MVGFWTRLEGTHTGDPFTGGMEHLKSRTGITVFGTSKLLDKFC